MSKNFNIVKTILPACRFIKSVGLKVHPVILTDNSLIFGELIKVELSFLNGIDLLIIEPVKALAMYPQTIHKFLFVTYVDPETMLLTFIPPALVFPPVFPLIDSISLFFVVLELSMIFCFVVIDEHSEAICVVV